MTTVSVPSPVRVTTAELPALVGRVLATAPGTPSPRPT